METLFVVASGAAFAACFLLDCLACGLLTVRLLGPARADSDNEGRQRVLSPFSGGHGVCPVRHGRGPAWVFSRAGRVSSPVSGCVPPLAGRRGLPGLARRPGAGRPGPRGTFLQGGRENRLAAGLAGCVAALLLGYVLLAAVKPLWHGDTLIYAVEAKAMREARSYTGRLEPMPKPDEHNYLRMNGHPIAYEGLLGAGLTFAWDRTQDLPLRLALQTQNVVLLLVLLGLGLRFGPLGVVACAASLLLENYFGALIDMSSRESYRVIPVLLALGLTPGVRRPLRLLSGRGLLTLAVWTYLWSAHTGSLVVAPLLLLCLMPVLRGPGALPTTLACCAAGFLLGANQLLLAVVQTGNPLHFELYHSGVTYIAPPNAWNSAPPPPVGLASMWPRFFNQAQGDGWPGVALLVFGLCATGVLACRRRPLPALVTAAALLALLSEMQVLGLFDWLSPSFGAQNYMVARYRFMLYPLGGLLAAYALSRMETKSWCGPTVRLTLALTLALGGMASAGGFWDRSPLDMAVVRSQDALARLNPVKSCWAETLRLIGEDHSGRPVVVFTDAPVIVWYYTDLNVHSLHSERLRPARETKDPTQALALLDSLGVTHVQLDKADTLVGTALGAAIFSSAFVQVGDCIYDRVYARVYAR